MQSTATYLHRIEVGDESDNRVQAAEALQNGILADFRQTSLASGVLDTIGEELTTIRGLSFDISGIRIRLRKQGVRLKDIPELDPDLRELDAETKRTLDAFHSEHRDQLGERFTLDRSVVEGAVSRASTESLLVTGEPGTGKTGVLMSVAHKLRDCGYRVWFLSVEGYEAESLPSLEKELNLNHRLTDIFGFAAESTNCVLLIDGLDAARDRVKQLTWRNLVHEAQRRAVTVVATIRFFDLRHSLPWQELFPQSAAELAPNGVSGLDKVRFINVGELSHEELNKALLEFPNVQGLAESQPVIRALAKNIFNFNLLCELAEGGTILRILAM